MKRKTLKMFRSTAGAWALESAATLAGLLPPHLRVVLAKALGSFFRAIAGEMRKALEDNLSRVLKVPAHELSRRSDEIFKNFGLTLLDFFFPEQVSIDVPDRAKLEEIRKQNKGVLVLTFHMGNWELGARTMQQWDWPVTAVYQPYQNKKFKAVIEKRRAPGVNFIPVGGKAAEGVRHAFRRGDVVAMLGDHPFGETGIPVRLLGNHVLWPKGPIVLAVKEETPIVVAVIIRTAPHHYTAIIEDPLIPQSKTKEEIERLVQAVADKFGSLVSRYSSQWYRFRRFEFVEEPKEKRGQVKTTGV